MICRPDYSPFSKKITRMRLKPRKKKLDKLKQKTKEKMEKLRRSIVAKKNAAGGKRNAPKTASVTAPKKKARKKK